MSGTHNLFLAVVAVQAISVRCQVERGARLYLGKDKETEERDDDEERLDILPSVSGPWTVKL